MLPRQRDIAWLQLLRRHRMAGSQGKRNMPRSMVQAFTAAHASGLTAPSVATAPARLPAWVARAGLQCKKLRTLAALLCAETPRLERGTMMLTKRAGWQGVEKACQPREQTCIQGGLHGRKWPQDASAADEGSKNCRRFLFYRGNFRSCKLCQRCGYQLSRWS